MDSAPLRHPAGVRGVKGFTAPTSSSRASTSPRSATAVVERTARARTAPGALLDDAAHRRGVAKCSRAGVPERAYHAGMNDDLRAGVRSGGRAPTAPRVRQRRRDGRSTRPTCATYNTTPPQGRRATARRSDAPAARRALVVGLGGLDDVATQENFDTATAHGGAVRGWWTAAGAAAGLDVSTSPSSATTSAARGETAPPLELLGVILPGDAFYADKDQPQTGRRRWWSA